MPTGIARGTLPFGLLDYSFSPFSAGLIRLSFSCLLLFTVPHHLSRKSENGDLPTFFPQLLRAFLAIQIMLYYRKWTRKEIKKKDPKGKSSKTLASARI